MKKIITFVYLLFTTFMAGAQTTLTSYTGTIRGYNSNMGFSTGQVIVNNVITGVHDNYLITIQSDGSFSASFPLTHTQECFIMLPFYNTTVYFEAGKRIIQHFDITDSGQVNAVFKGDCATINNALNELRPISTFFDWDAVDNDIFQLQPAAYKAYFLKMMDRRLAAIDSVVHLRKLNTRAGRLAKLQVTYSIMSTLMNYAFERESSYRRKMNISFNDRKQILEEIKTDSSYYDFLQSLSYNDPNNMVSYGYFEFITRLMHIPPVEEEAQRTSILAANEIIARAARDTSYKGLNELKKAFEEIRNGRSTIAGTLEKARPVVLKRLIRKDISLELDLIYLHSIGSRLHMQKDTLSKVDIQKIKSDIKNKVLITDIAALNDQVKKSIWEARNADSKQYIRLAADLKTDSTYKAIFEQYKGKVVFVDFWATWCSPCIQGIKRMAPLKDELAADSNVVFLYITDQTSPEQVYQTIMPGIKGVHYRITNDQFNYLSTIFRMNGRPHYAIIGKKGIPVHTHFVWTDPAQIKKELQLLEIE
ncbi:TlpA family protein disulfide reductase [Chitinophaga agri]|uniref:TlpA family protein disulfide reductase n=1 Tax=Chitinophaga agri TaxID=2703787 RepID=A0A6B9Z955_9BACT|nr:TlpA disulfide reductase family protein [Chitinophaga agri]QHS58802.1 TlpA family protein disulfide reductase [Chitinophaga agri]